jgi:hypothetical protein
MAVSATLSSPRQLFQMLDSGQMTRDEFREAMKLHALEIIDEMEEDHLNPVAALLEQVMCRRTASKLLKKNNESLVREVLLTLSEMEDFPPARWLWNAGHPHIPLHAFFRSKRRPIFQVLTLEAKPQVVVLTVEYGLADSDQIIREEIRLRRDRHAHLGVEQRKNLPH